MEVKVDTDVPPPASKGLRQSSIYLTLLPYFEAMTEPEHSCFIPVGITPMSEKRLAEMPPQRILQQHIGATGATYKKRNPDKTQGARYQTAQVTEAGVLGVRVWRK